MVEDTKEAWPLLAKILAGAGAVGLVARELLRIWKSPKQAREQTEIHYSELFLARIRELEADCAQIRKDNENRLLEYRRELHDARGKAHQVQIALNSLGFEYDYETKELTRIWGKEST